MQTAIAAESASTESDTNDLLALANEEIARKDLQLRDAKKQLEIFTSQNQLK